MISTSQFYPEVSFNAVISACEKGKMWQRTFDLWHYMCCKESLQPDLITYNALLKLKKVFSKRWGIQTKQVINVIFVFFLPGGVCRQKNNNVPFVTISFHKNYVNWLMRMEMLLHQQICGGKTSWELELCIQQTEGGIRLQGVILIQVTRLYWDAIIQETFFLWKTVQSWLVVFAN